MKNIFSQVSQQFPALLNSLEASNWDYHFATIPLTRDRALNQVVGSKYDPNWGSWWIAPFPGATEETVASINPNFFRQPDEYTGFLNSSDPDNSNNGLEAGFYNIRKALTERMSGTGFLRDDAMLVVIAMSNGEDTSDIKYCYRIDGDVTVPCDSANADTSRPAWCGTPGVPVSQCTTRTQSYNNYVSFFQNFKPSPDMIRFFATVGHGTQDCFGATARNGQRYRNMALNFGGSANDVDVCNTPMTAVVNQLASQLQPTVLGKRTKYLFIDQRPEESTIAITKYVNGVQSGAVTIPHNAQNGWTYAGLVTDLSPFDYPVAFTQMSKTSGYAIELHGSARLTGNDTASVTFKPYGAAK